MFRPVAQIPLDYSVFKDKNSVFAWAPSGAILFGNGCVARTGQELKRLGVSRVVVVSDQGLVKAGIVQKVLDALEQAGVTYQLYDQCEADPSVETVEAIAALAKDADLLVGVGGGSSIDPAKAAAILVTNGGSIRDYQGCDKFSKAPLPLVAIPTAAGTGTETTPFAVITDRQRAWKMPIGGTGIMPALVIADPELTYSLPPHITAATGMDALTHAIEAYTSRPGHQAAGQSHPARCFPGRYRPGCPLRYDDGQYAGRLCLYFGQPGYLPLHGPPSGCYVSCAPRCGQRHLPAGGDGVQYGRLA